MTASLARTSTVPFIAPWSSEATPAQYLVCSALHGVLAYTDEQPDDRAFGALWNRRGSSPGVGRPEFGNIHPRRQLAAMRDLGCQVCGQPADQDDRGVLWLLEDNRNDWPDWPNELMTTHPPICLPHAREAVTACPHLVDGYVVVRVGESEPVAVYGRHYAIERGRIVPNRREVVELDSARLQWTVAGQLIRDLRRCKIVDLAAEPGTVRP
ncbi:hypothetical protein ACFVJK_42885 [Streptomyces sp. NPDC127172]|uniref:hypothetical protein n=1 Tax=Streptomyces sp. NPDC127172 TaxID=3345382 RepID=UPI00362B397D